MHSYVFMNGHISFRLTLFVTALQQVNLWDKVFMLQKKWKLEHCCCHMTLLKQLAAATPSIQHKLTSSSKPCLTHMIKCSFSAWKLALAPVLLR